METDPMYSRACFARHQNTKRCMKPVKPVLQTICPVNHIQRRNHQRILHPDLTTTPKSQDKRVWKIHMSRSSDSLRRLHTAIKSNPPELTMRQRRLETNKVFDLINFITGTCHEMSILLMGSWWALLYANSIFSAGEPRRKTGRKSGWPARSREIPPPEHRLSFQTHHRTRGHIRLL